MNDEVKILLPRKKGKYNNICEKCKNNFIANSNKKKHCNKCDKELSTHICEKCKIIFTKKIRKGRRIRCNKCKRQSMHYKDNIVSITDCSKRTISKILRRSKIGCSICKWNKSTCDLHHIVSKKNGGSEDNNNIIVVCPNCHREIHTNKNYSIKFLKTKSINKLFKNWKDFYYVSN